MESRGVNGRSGFANPNAEPRNPKEIRIPKSEIDELMGEGLCPRANDRTEFLTKVAKETKWERAVTGGIRCSGASGMV